MVPSTIPTNITQTPGSQYYILNKPPVLNCYIPPATVLTEKDILAMPTVIVNDDRPIIKSTKKTKGMKLFKVCDKNWKIRTAMLVAKSHKRTYQILNR